jgi:hypothetical protein
MLEASGIVGLAEGACGNQTACRGSADDDQAQEKMAGNQDKSPRSSLMWRLMIRVQRVFPATGITCRHP